MPDSKNPSNDELEKTETPVQSQDKAAEDERKVVVAEIIGEDVDSPKVKEILTLLHSSYEGYEGPLPHPKHFKEYAEIIGDKGDRILTMAEKEANHRHEINRYNMSIHEKVTNADIERANRGQFMFYSIILIFVMGGVIGLFLDKPLAGYSSLGGAFITALVNVFGPKFSDWNPFDGKESGKNIKSKE